MALEKASLNEDIVYRQKYTESARVQIPATHFYFHFYQVEHR